jgi:RNA polymerase sigma-70 factor (ECF subfamily)
MIPGESPYKVLKPVMDTQESSEKKKQKKGRESLSREEIKKQQEFQEEAVAHINSLYNYALHLTMNPDDAEDLVQETYLKAYKFFNSFERGTNCKAWLFKILKNNYINRFRKNSREPGKVDYDLIKDFYHSIKDVRSDTSEADSDYFHSLMHEEVYQALQSLPEEFREVIQLCDIEGFTYEEIANMVESPIGTVRSRLYRGRKLLRGQLENYARKYGFNTNSEE